MARRQLSPREFGLMGSDSLQERWIATTSLLWRFLAEQLNELPIEVPHLP